MSLFRRRPPASRIDDLLRRLGDRLPPQIVATAKEYAREDGDALAVESLGDYVYDEWIQLTPEEIAAIMDVARDSGADLGRFDCLPELVEPRPSPELIVVRELASSYYPNSRATPAESAARILVQHPDDAIAVAALLHAAASVAAHPLHAAIRRRSHYPGDDKDLQALEWLIAEGIDDLTRTA